MAIKNCDEIFIFLNKPTRLDEGSGIEEYKVVEIEGLPQFQEDSFFEDSYFYTIELPIILEFIFKNNGIPNPNPNPDENGHSTNKVFTIYIVNNQSNSINILVLLKEKFKQVVTGVLIDEEYISSDQGITKKRFKISDGTNQGFDLYIAYIDDCGIMEENNTKCIVPINSERMMMDMPSTKVGSRGGGGKRSLRKLMKKKSTRRNKSKRRSKLNRRKKTNIKKKSNKKTI